MPYYNQDRPHRTLRLDTPQPQGQTHAGPVQLVPARPVLGGLRNVYESGAAETAAVTFPASVLAAAINGETFLIDGVLSAR